MHSSSDFGCIGYRFRAISVDQIGIAVQYPGVAYMPVVIYCKSVTLQPAARYRQRNKIKSISGRTVDPVFADELLHTLRSL